MARYIHLPIYKKSYDLLIEIFKITREFTREYKYTIGEKLKNETMELIMQVYKANNQKNKIENLEVILEKVLVIELLLRLSRDIRVLSLKKYTRIIQITDEIARQAQGWLKSQSGQDRPE